MAEWLKELDELLRGRKSDPELLAQGTSHIHMRPLACTALALAAVYGVAMGLFAAVNHDPGLPQQILVSAVKVPALFALSLIVTFPSLYVFTALCGLELDVKSALRIMVAAIAVNTAVLASFATITAFFTFTTDSYPFMKLLNVAIFALSGGISLGFLLSMARRLLAGQMADRRESDSPQRPQLGVVQLWMAVYALVGAQMGWILRPFIGDPAKPFELFRERGGNVFLDVIQALNRLLTG
jgi:hypothetical protein